MLAIANLVYFFSQLLILFYCWTVSVRITSQPDDQHLKEEEEELQKDKLDLLNEFVKLYGDQEA